MATTCTARTAAATRTSTSPAPGARNPSAWVSSTTPATAVPAARKKRPGSARPVTQPCSTGVMRIVSEMISPAFAADVRVTPNVSSTKISARTAPSAAPVPSSCRVSPRSRGARSSAMASTATAKRSDRTASTASGGVEDLAAR